MLVAGASRHPGTRSIMVPAYAMVLLSQTRRFGVGGFQVAIIFLACVPSQYDAKNGKCKTCTEVFKISGYEDVPHNDEKAPESAVSKQPVSVGIEVRYFAKKELDRFRKVFAYDAHRK